ncbi:MAG TPA: TetR/AcrR family transcriptional regulator [Thermoleophilaceae bacterium]|nr:TetR/AcrR family transcriptional regulator [Thermoleophilaceae bacterium]
MNAVDIASSQRKRLLAAMATVVAEKGYAATTVADVVSTAGVSRSTFYELFASKEACFLDAYDQGVEDLLSAVRGAVHDAQGDWRAQLRAGIRAYLAQLAHMDHFARMYIDEIHAVGANALAARADALRRFADRYHASFSQARAADPSLREPDPDALLVLCAGTEQLVAERLRAGGDVRELEDVFCTCAEAVLTHHQED